MGSGYTNGIYTTLPASFGTFAITNITEGRWPTGSYPTFSPDGKKIAFARQRTNGNDLVRLTKPRRK
jgi:Tol biopolymer transport system component